MAVLPIVFKSTEGLYNVIHANLSAQVLGIEYWVNGDRSTDITYKGFMVGKFFKDEMTYKFNTNKTSFELLNDIFQRNKDFIFKHIQNLEIGIQITLQDSPEDVFLWDDEDEIVYFIKNTETKSKGDSLFKSTSQKYFTSKKTLIISALNNGLPFSEGRNGVQVGGMTFHVYNEVPTFDNINEANKWFNENPEYKQYVTNKGINWDIFVFHMCAHGIDFNNALKLFR
jgi:hypothetical protein